MSVISTQIVKTKGEAKPYKVILEYEEGRVVEHPVNSIKEGEALIREKTPIVREEPFPEGDNS